MINIAVLGHGVVGSGVVELIQQNQANVSKNAGDSVYVKRILDLRDFDVEYKDRFTKDYNDILADDEISVVVEVMGGINPAFDFTKKALEAKKSVVTSNKELVAMKGAELLKIAKENNVNYYFEASVGGGIPVIRPMFLCLAANNIEEIAGILNGTTNFILTKMVKEQMGFDEALKIAQDLGYAEKNPEADVEGHDACRKICILASLAYGKHIYPEKVYAEGITKITVEDAKYAEKYNCVIKLIGRVKKLDDEGNVSCSVTPAFISKESQLSSIDDVFNGILIRGNATGDVVFYGRGAGKLPTASAVVADVIHVSKLKATSHSLSWEDDNKNYVAKHLDMSEKFYVRVEGDNLEEKVKAVFGDVEYIASEEQNANEKAFIIELINEQVMIDKVAEIEALGVAVLGKIRVLNY